MNPSKDINAKKRLKTAHFSTVISIALMLYVLGLLALLLLSANQISNNVKENIGLTVILTDSISTDNINTLQNDISSRHFVKNIDFVSKDKAAEILKKDLGEDFVDFIGYNPLQASFEIKFKSNFAHIDSIEIYKKSLLKSKYIEEIIFQKPLIQEIEGNINKISYFLFGFSAILLLISLALINNTIRLAVYSKRFLIRSMQLVGAKQSFIRKPFLKQSLTHGILGGVLASIAVYFTYMFFQNELMIQSILSLENIIIVFSIIIILGIFITWTSTFFAVYKYLKIKNDYLYYY